MTNDELIAELRDWAGVQGAGSLAAILDEAADRIKELAADVADQKEKIALLEERVAIMEEGCR